MQYTHKMPRTHARTQHTSACAAAGCAVNAPELCSINRAARVNVRCIMLLRRPCDPPEPLPPEPLLNTPPPLLSSDALCCCASTSSCSLHASIAAAAMRACCCSSSCWCVETCVVTIGAHRATGDE